MTAAPSESDAADASATLRLAGLNMDGGVALRSDVLAMTDAAMAAVVAPKDPGGLSRDERAALACRIARLHDSESLAAHYDGHVGETVRPICNPAFDGGDDGRLAAILAFTDLVSRSPRDATADDIAALKAAGVAEADIVRLAELNAFLAYQVRVVEGLSLLDRNA